MAEALLKVRNLKKYFPIRGGLLSREVARVHAVDDVSFDIMAGETRRLAGESGRGKATAGPAILGLVQPPPGAGPFPGRNVAPVDTRPPPAPPHEVPLLL